MKNIAVKCRAGFESEIIFILSKKRPKPVEK